MYLEIFLADFAVFCVFWGISWDFAEMPEFRGSATARNIRSPAHDLLLKSKANATSFIKPHDLHLKWLLSRAVIWMFWKWTE